MFARGRRQCFVVVSLLAQIALVAASTGDRLPEFRDCVSQKVTDSCPRDLGLLRLLAWDCESDCDYICQQVLTDRFETEHLPIHQFHGKWPFRRYFGIQEIASALFSLLNLIPNYIGFRILRKLSNGDGFYLRNYYIAFSLVGINTWLWSTVFHIRDLPLTEKLDYFSAIGQILFGLFIALVRILRLDHPSHRVRRYIIIACMSLFYFGHVSYLSFVRFNYAYNMLAGIIIGVTQTLLWIYLGMKLYVRTRETIDLLPVALVLSVMLGMSFEINDFSPYWRLIDAHSLWHASTVLPTFFWYKWMSHDLRRHERVDWATNTKPTI